MAGKLRSSNGSLRNLKCRHRLEETQVLQSIQEVRIPVKSQPNVNDHCLVITNSYLVSHNQRHLEVYLGHGSEIHCPQILNDHLHFDA